ncbi:hypothetical protein SSX86_031625, partial [Deinandra increscens subsp. villosa]
MGLACPRSQGESIKGREEGLESGLIATPPPPLSPSHRDLPLLSLSRSAQHHHHSPSLSPTDTMVKRDPRLIAAALELETTAAAARAAAAAERAAATTAAAAARAAVAADIFGEDHREVVLALPAPPRPLFEPSRAATVEPGENPKWPAPLYVAAVTPLRLSLPRVSDEIDIASVLLPCTTKPFDWNAMIHSMVLLP